MKLFRKAGSWLLTSLAAIGLIAAEVQGQIKIAANVTGSIIIALIPTISINKLPSEAKDTLNLIRRGGPFPYQKDGTVFQNRERRLPAKPRGYYREYTVPTPRSRDRGARRIVTGEGGEIYYTNDHYNTFFRVTE